MKKRIVSLLIAMIFIFSAVSLVACGEGSTGNDTEEITLDSRAAEISRYEETFDPRQTAETYVPGGAEEVTYGGHEFKFLNADEFVYMYIYLDPDMTGDVLDDTCFRRNLIAEQKFDITISEEAQPYAEIAGYAKNLILSDEDIYDVMYIPAASLTPLISESLFYDLLEIDELHLDKVWWDQPLITRNIVEDRLFYATSDLHLQAFEGIWCMYFNEEMMIDLGLELPFQLALDGKWTIDELKKYCAEAANLNGDTTFTYDVNGNATYGVVDFGNADYFAYGLGAEYASRDENGRYQFTADTDTHFNSVWETLIKFVGPTDGNYLIAAQGDLEPDGYFTVFMEDRALFLHAELKGATMLREWDGKFGLMPQPKYDESQEAYNSNIFKSCLSFCIPTTNTELERTGKIVDYLTYESYAELMPRYYDIHVALKALGREESIEVLDHIRGTRGCEVAVPFGWAWDLNEALRALTKKNEMALASTIESFRDQVVANITATYNEYPSLKHVEK